MPRPLRIEFPGACYHLVNRGDRREAIFADEDDYQRFLGALGEACEKTGWRVHAYCLLANHFHLVIGTPQPNLVAGMKWLLGTYTIRFNHRHRSTGHLFAGRYKALLVDTSSAGYLQSVCEYVHLNPSRASALTAAQRLRDYRWSSFGDYLTPHANRPVWLEVNQILGPAGLFADDEEGRQRFDQHIEARRAAETSGDWRMLRRGWCYGSDAFRESITEKIGAASASRLPRPARESAAAKAEDILRDELASRRWQEKDLVERRKGDPEKIQIARRLRRETTVTLKWVAERLRMGTWTYVANLIYAHERALTHSSATPARQARPAPRTGHSFVPAKPIPSKIESERPTATAAETVEPGSPFGEDLPLHCL